MKYRIQARNLSLSRPLFEHVRRRFDRAIDHLRGGIASAHIRLEDLNGPRGGSDKSCSVLLRLVGGGVLHLEQRGDCFFGAVDQLARRAKQSLSRRVGRLREGRRLRRLASRRTSSLADPA